MAKVSDNTLFLLSSHRLCLIFNSHEDCFDFQPYSDHIYRNYSFYGSSSYYVFCFIYFIFLSSIKLLWLWFTISLTWQLLIALIHHHETKGKPSKGGKKIKKIPLLQVDGNFFTLYKLKLNKFVRSYKEKKFKFSIFSKYIIIKIDCHMFSYNTFKNQLWKINALVLVANRHMVYSYFSFMVLNWCLNELIYYRVNGHSTT